MKVGWQRTVENILQQLAGLVFLAHPVLSLTHSPSGQFATTVTTSRKAATAQISAIFILRKIH